MPVPHAALTVLIIAIVAFLMYRRVRRQLGRQPLQPGRTFFRAGLLAVIATALLALSPHTLANLGAAGGGLAVGLALAWYALRHTRFETTAAGARFYTPNPWIGAGVSALLIGRVLARFATGFSATAAAATPAPGADPFAGMGRNPLTLGLFFVVAAYNLAYGLSVHLRPAAPVDAAPPSPAAAPATDTPA